MSRIRRTMLWIPGNNPGMMVNAPIMNADTVIFDIEDAVVQAEKDAARFMIRNALLNLPIRAETAIRINGINTPLWEEDLETVLPSRPDTVVVPKLEKPEELTQVENALDRIERENSMPVGKTRLIPILETALGIENAFLIASCKCARLDAVMIGGEDLATDLMVGRSKSGEEILFARSRVVLAARAAGLAPIDTVFTDVEDMEGLETDTRLSRKLGFAGRAVISPRHLKTVNRMYSPSAEEIADAQEVIKAVEEGERRGIGAVSRNGKMIDAPIVARARNVLEIGLRLKEGNV